MINQSCPTVNTEPTNGLENDRCMYKGFLIVNLNRYVFNSKYAGCQIPQMYVTTQYTMDLHMYVINDEARQQKKLSL